MVLARLLDQKGPKTHQTVIGGLLSGKISKAGFSTFNKFFLSTLGLLLVFCVTFGLPTQKSPVMMSLPVTFVVLQLGGQGEVVRWRTNFEKHCSNLGYFLKATVNAILYNLFFPDFSTQNSFSSLHSTGSCLCCWMFRQFQ